MAEWIASSSSTAGAALGRAAVTARGIRILDAAEGERRRMVSLGLQGEEEETAPALPLAMAVARGCDVYVGHGGEAQRVAAWMRAELEMLGVPCVAADRRRCGDAPAHAAARAAMDAAAAGVVVVTPASLRNPYAVEEIRAFARRGALVAVLVGVGRADLGSVEDVVERRGELWGRHGGPLWKAYDGDEAEWKEVVGVLARADLAVEIGAGSLRNGVLNVVEVVGARLGRRAVATAVKSWRDAAGLELPFPRNPGFLGREKELLDLEAALLGSARACGNAAEGKKKATQLDDLAVDEGPFIDGVICISGVSGTGKTELALEFAHRHAQEYKQVLWAQGEARYLRQGFLKLADRLDVVIGEDVSQAAERCRNLHDVEGDAIAKIRKELARDIPYLVVLDNVESLRDWWDGRDLQELLPRAGSKRSHVVVTTRLAGVQGVRTLALGSLSATETMQLMKGTRTCSVEDMAILRGIEEKVGSVPLGVALVGAMLSELAVSPAELRDAMSCAPHRAATWATKQDPVLRNNPGLVQLLDACFALLNREAVGLGTMVLRLAEVSSFFAPAPIAVAMLAGAAGTGASAGEPLWKRLARTLHLSCTSPGAPQGGGGGAEPETMLLRLGIARWCTRAGCIAVHSVFKQFGRKVGGGGRPVAGSVVRAIAAAHGCCGGARADHDHTWAACLSLFRFEASAAAAELPAPELAAFVARVVLPLAAHAVTAYSAYSAALELLREATDAVREAEDRYVSAGHRRGGGGGGGGVEPEPKVYQEMARGRAELLRARARMMLRAGERAIAEDHCLAAINILEVVCGDAHPETQAVRAFLERNVRARHATN